MPVVAALHHARPRPPPPLTVGFHSDRSATTGLNTGMQSEKETRHRLPRALGSAGELLPYSEMSAKSQQLLAELVASGSSKVRPLAEGRYSGVCHCGGPNAFGSKQLVTTTAHVIAISTSGGGGSSSSGSGGGAIEWFERLSNIAAAEVSGAEVVLHLRDGGMRFVPCAHSPGARQELFRVVMSALAPCL